MSADKFAQGVAATGLGAAAAFALELPGVAIAANDEEIESASASGMIGAQSAGASSGQAAAVVRVASVGAGVLRVSWLARSVIEAFFLSPPVIDRPRVCA